MDDIDGMDEIEEMTASERLKEKIEEEMKAKSVVPVPTRAPRKPRNILRAEHLTSKKGIVALPEIIKVTKFKGKGHEVEDLRTLLFNFKHWAHRLHPAATFEDFIEKAELLGHKRPVKNFLEKIRQNQPLFLDPDEILRQSDEEDGDNFNEDLIISNEQDGNDSPKGKSKFDFDALFQDHLKAMKEKDADEA